MISLNFAIGGFELYPELIVGTIKADGGESSPEFTNILIASLKEFYSDGRPVGYISIREEEGGQDPVLNIFKENLINLKCVAIVEPTISESTIKDAEERLYVSGRLKVFGSSSEALLWVSEILNEVKNQEAN